jgi:hypothetical protein
MTVRFASFNVENLFARPKALNQDTWAEGARILDAFAELNQLIERVIYTPSDKARMIELLIQLDVYRRNNGVVRRNRTLTPRWAWLRANRGTFDVEREATGVEIVANSRAAWTGWVELAVEPVDEITTRMTAQVIHEVGADVLAVIEAENRPSLDRFNQDLLGRRYEHVMLIDGNDSRGIDVGIMTSNSIEIASMRSNVDVPDPGAAGQHLFSRGCVEFECRMPGGESVWVLQEARQCRTKNWSGRTRTTPARSQPAFPPRGRAGPAGTRSNNLSVKRPAAGAVSHLRRSLAGHGLMISRKRSIRLGMHTRLLQYSENQLRTDPPDGHERCA